MAKPKPNTPKKPRPDFPLFPHSRGYWCKKVKGRLRYFNKIVDDPKGAAALQAWLDQKDDLMAGREPRAKGDLRLAVRRLCDHFIAHKEDLLKTGEIVQWTYNEYHATCKRLCVAFGRDRPIDDLVADDFRKLRAQIAKQWGPVRLSNEIQRVRSIFKYGFEAGLLDKPVRFGPNFKKPSAKVLRKNRADAGKRMFEREELLALLGAAPPIQKAMVLLGINCAFGNHDVATLPIKAVNFKTGWVTYARPKTGIDRKIPLWPETIAALKAVLATRHAPKNPADKNLLFISEHGGEPYISENSGHRIAKTILFFLRKAKVDRPGLTFYALRHTFQTVAEGARDLSAVQSVMGHAASGSDMSAQYRERVDDDRLVAVTEHVRRWLFGPGSVVGDK
jgi:integrase